MAKSKGSEAIAGKVGGPQKKTVCPITRDQFHKSAKPLALKVGDQTLVLAPKEFKGKSGEVDGTGSLGWFGNDKVVVEIDGVPCKVQPSISLVIVGSKVE